MTHKAFCVRLITDYSSIIDDSCLESVIMDVVLIKDCLILTIFLSFDFCSFYVTSFQSSSIA